MASQSQEEGEMTTKREGNTSINPEAEEDGEAHLEEMIDRDEGFRRVWEANRSRRELGMIVLEKRLDLGLSQRELAGRIGTSRNRIHLIENGEANPTLDTLQRLAEVLGLALEHWRSDPEPWRFANLRTGSITRPGAKVNIGRVCNGCKGVWRPKKK